MPACGDRMGTPIAASKGYGPGGAASTNGRRSRARVRATRSGYGLARRNGNFRYCAWHAQANFGARGPTPVACRAPILGSGVERSGHATVDYELCAGHGQCLLAAPDVFDLPDGSEQVVIVDQDPAESEYGDVVRAAAMCPAQALRVVD
jgi:ferredoxin